MFKSCYFLVNCELHVFCVKITNVRLMTMEEEGYMILGEWGNGTQSDESDSFSGDEELVNNEVSFITMILLMNFILT